MQVYTSATFQIKKKHNNEKFITKRYVAPPISKLVNLFRPQRQTEETEADLINNKKQTFTMKIKYIASSTYDTMIQHIKSYIQCCRIHIPTRKTGSTCCFYNPCIIAAILEKKLLHWCGKYVKIFTLFGIYFSHYLH